MRRRWMCPLHCGDAGEGVGRKGRGVVGVVVVGEGEEEGGVVVVKKEEVVVAVKRQCDVRQRDEREIQPVEPVVRGRLKIRVKGDASVLAAQSRHVKRGSVVVEVPVCVNPFSSGFVVGGGGGGGLKNGAVAAATSLSMGSSLNGSSSLGVRRKLRVLPPLPPSGTLVSRRGSVTSGDATSESVQLERLLRRQDDAAAPLVMVEFTSRRRELSITPSCSAGSCGGGGDGGGGGETVSVTVSREEEGCLDESVRGEVREEGVGTREGSVDVGGEVERVDVGEVDKVGGGGGGSEGIATVEVVENAECGMQVDESVAISGTTEPVCDESVCETGLVRGGGGDVVEPAATPLPASTPAEYIPEQSRGGGWFRNPLSTTATTSSMAMELTDDDLLLEESVRLNRGEDPFEGFYSAEESGVEEEKGPVGVAVVAVSEQATTTTVTRTNASCEEEVVVMRESREEDSMVLDLGGRSVDELEQKEREEADWENVGEEGETQQQQQQQQPHSPPPSSGFLNNGANSSSSSMLTPSPVANSPKLFTRSGKRLLSPREASPSGTRESPNGASPNGKFQCLKEGCGKAYYTEWHLKRHTNLHASNPSFQCTLPDCFKTFQSQYHLDRHILVHSRYKCPHKKCGKQFPGPEELTRHKEIAHPVVGGVVKTQESHVAVRVATPTPPPAARGSSTSLSPTRSISSAAAAATTGPFICDFEGCGKIMSTKYNLVRHVTVQHDPVTMARKLKRAMKEQKVAAAPIECTVEGCGRVFPSLWHLERHLVAHRRGVVRRSGGGGGGGWKKPIVIKLTMGKSGSSATSRRGGGGGVSSLRARSLSVGSGGGGGVAFRYKFPAALERVVSVVKTREFECRGVVHVVAERRFRVGWDGVVVFECGEEEEEGGWEDVDAGLEMLEGRTREERE
ncbi:hypothetical protein HDU98_004562, partial [Podochytrium sp. JEL0797]